MMINLFLPSLGPGSRAKGVFLGAGIGIGNAWARCAMDFENEKKTVKVDVNEIVKEASK